jgi:hypothetical protein
VDGGGGGQILVEVRNEGDEFAKVESLASFTLYAKDETVLDTGTLTAYPQYVGPGETGYLVAFVVFDTDDERESAGIVDPDVEFTSEALGRRPRS